MGYLFRLFSTGAIRETPKKVISKISHEITKKGTINIIELGAGKGEITASVMNKLTSQKVTNFNYQAFEIEASSCTILKTTYPQIKVWNVDAFEFKSFIHQNFKADYIICSIPLSFYSGNKIEQLLTDAISCLNSEGKIVIIFSAVWLKKGLRKLLNPSRIYTFITFPPYFLLVYNKTKNL